MYVDRGESTQEVLALYPQCVNATAAKPVHAIVDATLRDGRLEQVSAIIELVFGVAVWISQVLHGVAMECYLYATRDEDERLRKVSMVRRKASGFGTEELKGE